MSVRCNCSRRPADCEVSLISSSNKVDPHMWRRDTPLIHWWNKYSAYHGLAPASTPRHTIATLDHTGEIITAAGVDFRLHRTLRVPDSVKMNDLPPVCSSAGLQITHANYPIPGFRPISTFSDFKICSSLAEKCAQERGFHCGE